MNRNSVPLIVISCIVVLSCCLCSILLASAGIFEFFRDQEVVEIKEAIDLFKEDSDSPMPTPVLIRPDEVSVAAHVDMLKILEDTIVPTGNLNDLARRLGGITDIPAELPPTSNSLAVGTVDLFWVTDTDTNESFQIEATLQYVTDHTYFWIENGVSYDHEDLAVLAETFENDIYPLTREYFGSEWTPGIDGDPHLYIIYARGLGRNLAGYFSSIDEYHTLAHEFSNMHETFMLNADNLRLDEEYTYGVLAHEFQHMIHWYQDRNEEAWINEGLSELAAFLNGYDLGGFDYLYTSDTDLQLTDWPNDPSQTSPHYGASFMFVTYLLDRLGSSAIQTLAKHPENGMSSIDDILSDITAKDPLTGDPLTADDLFLDWVLTNYLKDPQVMDGRFAYKSYTDSPRTKLTEVVDSCPNTWQVRDVHQYGVDYIQISCDGDFKLQFEGSMEVDLLPVDPYSGDYGFWSNKGDDSDMMLTQSFDFTDHEEDLTLTYWTWYDIEEDYDYVYLEVSLDGDSWEILETPSGTNDDPSGNNFGWGYNGLSGQGGEWIQEVVDISQFSGHEVQVRFEYVTDAAVNGEGFLIDNIAIPEIGYFTDFESDDGGWQADGFVRIQNSLPQRFRLAIIETGENPTIHYLTLNDDNSIEFPIQIGESVEEIILVVTGTTRFSRQKAGYQYQIITK